MPMSTGPHPQEHALPVKAEPPTDTVPGEYQPVTKDVGTPEQADLLQVCIALYTATAYKVGLITMTTTTGHARCDWALHHQLDLSVKEACSYPLHSGAAGVQGNT